MRLFKGPQAHELRGKAFNQSVPRADELWLKPRPRSDSEFDMSHVDLTAWRK